ncbi:GNAT family N-acetyltransferase [Rummeliibacillus sp. NPDC094406]|uniref:GNAT family N-acetyltransferase n=1 Tax=Rummeliibacillus sp. NPDC094406 TaxID=3364511 RepID=UPI0038197D9C
MMILKTKNLYLREYQNEDLPSLHVIFSDAETMKYYPAPFSIEKTRKWIETNQNRYIQDGYGLWSVCLKDTNEVIGDCGITKQQVDGKFEAEIGYHINKKYWGKGYATEAATSCKEFGFNQLGLNKLICIIDPQNKQSIRVAEKIGFLFEKEAFVFNKLHNIYSITKDQ